MSTNESTTVFLIDDDDIFLMIAERILKMVAPEARVMKYDSVKGALEGIERESPDYIFLDLNMPVFDGWYFLDQLENGKNVPDCKIYINSSSINPKDIRRANEHPDVEGFLEKPWTREKIRKVVNGES